VAVLKAACGGLSCEPLQRQLQRQQLYWDIREILFELDWTWKDWDPRERKKALRELEN